MITADQLLKEFTSGDNTEFLTYDAALIAEGLAAEGLIPITLTGEQKAFYQAARTEVGIVEDVVSDDSGEAISVYGTMGNWEVPSSLPVLLEDGESRPSNYQDLA